MARWNVLVTRSPTVSPLPHCIRCRVAHDGGNAESVERCSPSHDLRHSCGRSHVSKGTSLYGYTSRDRTNVCSGSLFILVILFCLKNPEEILATATGMPIVEMVLQSTNSRAAATIISLMLGVCFVNGSSASVTSVSRLLFAMARDRGIVCHKYFAHIQSGLNVPVRTILLCYVFNVCFGLLYLGPSVAFSAYVASCTIFLNISYAFPIIVLLIRGRSVLGEHQNERTPFKMGRKLGLVVNIVAMLYLVVTSVVGHSYSRN